MEEIIEHPGYDGDVLNDIAVLRLAQEVSKSFHVNHMRREGEPSRTKKTADGLNSFGQGVMNGFTPK